MLPVIPGHLLELRLLIFADIDPIAFGQSVHTTRLVTLAKSLLTSLCQREDVPLLTKGKILPLFGKEG